MALAYPSAGTVFVVELARRMIAAVRLANIVRAKQQAGGSLEAAASHALGACREHQDYARAACLTIGAARRLHAITRAIELRLPDNR